MATRKAHRSEARQSQDTSDQPPQEQSEAPIENGAQSATLAYPNLMSAWNASSESWADSVGEASTAKQVAAAALILGQNVSKTAAALGVDRRTIQRWRKLDPEFQLAMIETKQEVIVSSRQNMLALAESAVRVVEKELNDEKSVRAALALLRGVGVLSHAALDNQQYEEVLELRKQFEEVAQDAEKEEAAQESDAQSATLEELPAVQGELPEEEAEDKVYELSDLPRTQQIAINAFYAGKRLAEVAQLAQTSESTLRGWLCQDRRFFSVLSDFQFERIQRMKHRIFALIDQAMQLVRRAVADGDTRVAMLVLRGLGLFS